jgi:hypothetical protein
MNKLTQFAAVAFIGVVAGFAGGAFATSILARSQIFQRPPEVIRAKQFEAIGEKGVARARFGLDSGDVPMMRFLGPDGQERLTIMLDNINEPIIMMKDIKGNMRAVFGHDTSDTASPDDDNWSVSFRAPGEDDNSAVLGVVRSYRPTPTRNYRGEVGMRDVKGDWHSLRPQ